jgi:hypothetical protein
MRLWVEPSVTTQPAKKVPEAAPNWWMQVFKLIKLPRRTAGMLEEMMVTAGTDLKLENTKIAVVIRSVIATEA